nr:hypothetical protein HK105_002396 [Polyrhizophydium stewartii]
MLTSSAFDHFLFQQAAPLGPAGLFPSANDVLVTLAPDAPSPPLHQKLQEYHRRFEHLQAVSLAGGDGVTDPAEQQAQCIELLRRQQVLLQKHQEHVQLERMRLEHQQRQLEMHREQMVLLRQQQQVMHIMAGGSFDMAAPPPQLQPQSQHAMAAVQQHHDSATTPPVQHMAVDSPSSRGPLPSVQAPVLSSQRNGGSPQHLHSVGAARARPTADGFESLRSFHALSQQSQLPTPVSDAAHAVWPTAASTASSGSSAPLSTSASAPSESSPPSVRAAVSTPDDPMDVCASDVPASAQNLAAPQMPLDSTRCLQEMQFLHETQQLQDQIDLNKLDIFFEYFYPIYPIVTKEAFLQTVETEPGVLLNAMYATAMRAPLLSSAVSFEMGDRGNGASPSAVFALVLLSMYASATRRMQDAMRFHALLIKTTLELGLHRESVWVHAVGAREQEKLRRLWWSALEMDIYVCLNTFLPSRLLACGFDVAFPAPEGVFVDASTARRTDAVGAGQLTAAASRRAGDERFFYSMLETEARGVHSTLLSPLRLQHQGLLLVLECFQFQQREPRDEPDDPAAARALETQRRELEARVEAWHSEFPPWMATLQPRYGRDLGSTQPPPWQAAFVLALYHMARIYLFEGALLRAVRARGSRASVVTGRAFDVCMESAHRIAAIARAYVRGGNGHMSYTSDYLAKVIQVAGRIHALSLLLESDGLWDVPRDHKLEMLDECIGALERTSEYFVLARLGAERLRELRSAAVGLRWLPAA